jgi:LPPG:FO 2-phospho-L-lactate transferase
VFVGGVGGAKLAYGLAQIVPPESLTIIVNTGDDFWLYGLRICPDLDTVMYTLAGVVDKNNGWGVADDTINMLPMMARYGEETWFRLGDQDLATHLLRTQWWHDGVTLTEITRRLAIQLAINCRLLPMTDMPVATRVDTIEYGELDFQTYFVRHRWQPTVKSLRFDGIEDAVVSSDFSTAIDVADVILIGPSNPWLSIAPILNMPHMRDMLVAHDIPRVAITPIIEGKAVKGPAAKLMAELGYEQSASAIAEYYGNVVNGFVFDERDRGMSMDNIRTVALDTMMQSESDRIRVAQTVLDWIGEWN